ncbi:MAG: hypothetical protein H6721_27890 [Sandaracinus sp.]|nr:hypothetical protein [Sandaracinus sp.]MCB9635949.1 hypothetical protein [Sandaracinus sp.]
MSRLRFSRFDVASLATFVVLSALGCGLDTNDEPVGSVTAAATYVVEQEPVRRLSGSPNLDSSGQASYEISLNVPPGRRDLAPTLSLRYGSGAGEGYFGQGFDLIGAGSRLHRCQKSVEDDGESSALRFDDRDRLCLDGMRLVGSEKDDEYWRIGARYQEQMSAWRRIERTGVDEFVVTGRDGTRQVYGSGTSTVRALRGERDAAGALIDTTTVVVEWRLARIEDAYGNFIAFEYGHEDHPDGAYEHYLEAIRYTGAPGEAPRREVLLHYQDRDGEETSYLAGTARRLSRLVTQIEMRVRDESVRRYEMDYKTDDWTRRSILRGLRECDRFDLCRDTTIFEWSEPSWTAETRELVEADPFLYREVTTLPTGPIAQTVLATDLDGDGADEVIYARRDDAYTIYLTARFGGGAEYVVPGTINTIFYADQPFMAALPSGGARNSLLLRRNADEGHRWSQWEFSAGSWIELDANLFNRTHNAYIGGYAYLGVSPVVGDVDGDGAPDAVWRALRRNLADVSDYNVYQEWWVSRLDPEAHWASSADRRQAYLASEEPHLNTHIPVDLDGDRRTDIVVKGPESIVLADIGSPRETLPEIYIDPASKWLFIDVNSDGLSDLLTIEESFFSIQMNTGRGFAAPREVFTPPSTWGDAMSFLAAEDIRQGDFDRDGRPDLLAMLVTSAGVGKAVVLRWNGTEFVTFDLPDAPYPVPVGTRRHLLGQITNFVTVLDHDGDGYSEFTQLGDHDGDIWLEVVEPRATARPASLERVVDGHANPTFEYADLSTVHFDQPFETGHPQPHRVCGVDEETGEYECYDVSPTRDCISSYPMQCVRNGLWVGTRMTVADGIGGRREITRHYSSARVDVRRGLGLGFARSQLISLSNAEVVDTEFDLTQFDVRDESGVVVDRRFPFAGQIRHENVFRWPNGELDEATWPPTSDHVVVHRKELGRRMQRARVDALGEDVRAYRAVQTSEEIQIYDAGSWSPKEALLASDLIHHWRTDHRVDEWGTTVLTTFKDSLGDTSTLAVSNVVNDVEEFRIGRVERRTVWSSESVFSESRSTKYVHVETPAGVMELRQVIVDEGEEDARTIDITYDDYGNVVFVEESGRNPDSEFGEPAVLRRTQAVAFEDTEHAFVESTTNALGHRTKFEFIQASGRLASSTDPNGITQTWLYDGFDQLVGHVHEGMVDQWSVSRSTATGWGCFVEKASLQGRTEIETYYDCQNRPIRVVEVWPDGRRSSARVDYDALGRVVRETLPFFEGEAEHARTFFYDGLDRLVRRVNPDGSAQTWAHERRVVTHENERGGVTKSEFDTMGRLASTTDHDNTSTKHFYGAFSRLREIDRRGSKTEFWYSRRGDLVELLDPSRGRRSYVHNAFGEVEQEVGIDGVRDFDYDDLGRPTLVVEPDGTYSKFDYDSSPRGIGSISGSTREADRVVTTKHGYDLYGRPNEMTLAVDGREITVRSDRNGRLLDRLTYDFGEPDPLTVDYAYEAGRVTHVDASLADWSTRLWTTLERDDPAGRATEVERGFRMTREFDPLSGRESLYQAQQGTRTLEAHSYDYVLDHYLDTDVDTLAGESFEYVYDKQGRLFEYQTSSTPLVSYRYDSFGNQRSGSNGDRTFDDPARPNILTGSEGLTFDHDDAGRRVGRSDGWRAEYHAFDLPRWIDDPSSGTTKYVYDAFETRVLEEHGSLDVLRFAGVRQLYDGGARKETSIGVTVEGERVAEVVVADGDAHVRWLSDGPHGTAQFALENGSISRHPRGEPFGGTTGGGELWSRFAGHDYEIKSPLVNAGARLYDPDNAAFLTPDPVFASAGIGANPYQYAFQNPNSYTDPSGMWPIGTSGIDCLSPGCLELVGLDVILNPSHAINIARSAGRPEGLSGGTTHGDSRGGARATSGGGRGVVEWDLALANFLDGAGVDDFFAGMGDSLSFGLTGRFRAATGVDATVDRSSDAYDNGEWGALATSLANVPGLIRGGVRAASRWWASRAKNVPWVYGDTGGALGVTDAVGNITIREGLTGNMLKETVLHEAVHRFFSPTSAGPHQAARARLGIWGYENSAFLRFTEEALAESLATGSIGRGLSFPFAEKYVKVGELLREVGVLGGAGYGITRLSNSLID